jgi:predicted dehydrogenase
MGIDFHGHPTDGPAVRAGFIGCGSHAFRNICPTLQFVPVDLVATCDLDRAKADAFARQFGAERAYTDYSEMLGREELDAVFVVTSYDERGRPLYPRIAAECLRAGCHVWMEKPPAATCAEIETLQTVAHGAGRNAMVGLKKMFFPANEKARELMTMPDFGRPSLVLLQYPQHVPTEDQIRRYLDGEHVRAAVSFLDHLCHPVSLLVCLLGMPSSLFYERAASGAANAVFAFESGAVASLALTCGASSNGGMERTTIVSDRGRHIVVDNNVRVTLHRSPLRAPGTGYGSAPTYYTGEPGQTSAAWEPEFSLGQLYNKGLFLLGYWGEVNEFARSILDGRPPARGTLEHAWQVTRVFEAFAEGPGRRIPLSHQEETR